MEQATWSLSSHFCPCTRNRQQIYCKMSSVSPYERQMEVCPESVINKCIQIIEPTSSNPTSNQSSLSTKCAFLTLLSSLIRTSVGTQQPSVLFFFSLKYCATSIKKNHYHPTMTALCLWKSVIHSHAEALHGTTKEHRALEIFYFPKFTNKKIAFPHMKVRPRY